MKQIAIAAHRSNYPTPIAFLAGDKVKTGRPDDEFPGWIWCQTPDGNEGWAPQSFLEFGNGSTAVAKSDYNAKELNVEPGEILETIQTLSGWIRCRSESGDEGWVPAKVLG